MQDLLCCPVSQLPLCEASPELVAFLLGLASQRALRNEAAHLIAADFGGAWVSADLRRAWLVKGGLPDFMPGAAVLLRKTDPGLPASVRVKGPS